ncbi:MAG: AraC family transcriptional regulator [Parvularculaceae bacterium]
MELRYHLPRADLLEFVRAYYVYETSESALQPLCAEMGNIRVVLNGGGILHTPDGRQHYNSSAFLIGPTLGACFMEAEPNTKVFGIGIRPKGWMLLCGMSAEEAADQVIDLTAFAGGLARSAIDELRNASDMASMAAAADRFFASLIARRVSRSTAGYSDALAHWLLDPGELGIDDLMAAMDVSRRTTDRIAKLYFGASPKYLQRKYRALRAADRIRAGVGDWMSAAGGPYYDQSHFIKEFRTFVGVTPGQFIGHQASLIAEIQSRRTIKSTPLPLASF